MTTNHKPTFESRRARDPYANGGSGILHGGATQRKLKYRKTQQDQDVTEHRKKFDELNRELQGADAKGGIDYGADDSEEKKKKEDVHVKSIKEVEEEEDNSSTTKPKEIDESKDRNSDSDKDSDSDSDSDSDEELLKELAQLKQDKQKKEEEHQQQYEQKSAKPLKKSWRQSAFRNKDSKDKGKDKQYINDLLKSRFHQNFMDKNVK